MISWDAGQNEHTQKETSSTKGYMPSLICKTMVAQPGEHCEDAHCLNSVQTCNFLNAYFFLTGFPGVLKIR